MTTSKFAGLEVVKIRGYAKGSGTASDWCRQP